MKKYARISLILSEYSNLGSKNHSELDIDLAFTGVERGKSQLIRKLWSLEIFYIIIPLLIYEIRVIS